jgi:hypothetical protein
MKRVVWFSAGAVTGFGGAVYGYVRVRRSARRPAAERVVNVIAETARTGVDGARRFVDDARDHIQHVESEMRRESVTGGDGSSTNPDQTSGSPSDVRRGGKGGQTG